MEITFSSVSGTLQLFLRCHCMGLMCNRPSALVSLYQPDCTCRSGYVQPVSTSSKCPVRQVWRQVKRAETCEQSFEGYCLTSPVH